MALFPTKKPRRFNERLIYKKRYDMNFHRERKQRQSPKFLVLAILLVLLLFLWFYL